MKVRVLSNVVKHEWLLRFPDDVKACPRELSVMTRIIDTRDHFATPPSRYIAPSIP